MGLDTVELVMDFEKAFSIEIPNEIAEKMVTPRDVLDFVVKEHERLGRPVDRDAIFARIQAMTADLAGENRKISASTRSSLMT